MRPSRRGPESVHESLSTDPWHHAGHGSQGVTREGKGGRIVQAGAIAKATQDGGSTTQVHPNPMKWPINTRSVLSRWDPAHEPAFHRMTGNPCRACRATASLRLGRTGTPDPRVRLQLPADSVKSSIGYPAHAGYTSLPFSRIAVKCSDGRTRPRLMPLSAAPTAHAATLLLLVMGFQATHTRPAVTPATRLSPAGEMPNSDSIQIKQQHCEVCRGDAADAARLAQRSRPDLR